MKIIWPDKYVELLNQMDIPFDFRANMSDSEILDLIEIVEDYLAMHGLMGSGDTTNDTGELCADILTLIAQSEV